MKRHDLKVVCVRCTASMLTAGMLMGNVLTLNTYAAQAGTADVEEKLYINLDDKGKVEKANVVKSVQFTIDDTYTDHGNYTEIVNMSDNQEPVVKGDSVTWTRPEGNGKFYFQGGLDPKNVKMPWDFTVTYKVNGIVTAPEKVGGAKGTVEIDIDAVPNKHVSEYMQNNMVLLVLIPMDTSDAYSIDAPESMSASFGNYSGIGFEALPGQEKHFEARIGTDSFESMGVMMIMTPVTAGDLSKVKDFKELEDKFRDNSNAVMDSMDALMDNVTDMSSQLAKTNQMLDQLANGKNKLDQNRTIIFDGVDTSLQDIRDLSALLDPLDTSLKTSQWMVYDINTNLNTTNNHLASTSAVMSTLSRKLRTLSNEMASTNTYSIESVIGDLDAAKTNLNALKTNLVKSGTALSNVKTITDSDEFEDAVDDVVTDAGIYDATYEEEYLPEAVIAVVKPEIKALSGNVSVLTEEQIQQLTARIAQVLDVYNVISSNSEGEDNAKYKVSSSNLQAVVAGLQAYQQSGDPSALQKALNKHLTENGLTDPTVIQPLILSMMQELAATVGKEAQTNENASRFVNRMNSLLELQDSVDTIENMQTSSGTSLRDSLSDLSDYGSEAVANAITAYASVDYDTALDEIDTVLADIDDVMEAGASVSYQTSRLLDSTRKITSDVDSLISILNSYYDDIQTAITNVSNLVEETEKTCDDLTRTGQTLNDTLRSAAEDFSAAGDTGIAVGHEAVDNANKMVENTRNLKEAGADLRQSINDKLDEEEEEHNFINMDPDAAKESFTSSENAEPSNISIICRTDEIKKADDPADTAKDALTDAEFPEESTTLGQRIMAIFTSFWNKILALVGKA